MHRCAAERSSTTVGKFNLRLKLYNGSRKNRNRKPPCHIHTHCVKPSFRLPQSHSTSRLGLPCLSHHSLPIMLRSLPRHVRLAKFSQPTRALSSITARPLALQSLASSSRRSYATETAIPPSPNDSFASGTNAYYAEEYVSSPLVCGSAAGTYADK